MGHVHRASVLVEHRYTGLVDPAPQDEAGTRYGRQPAYDALTERGYTVAVASRVTGLAYHRLYHALRGGGRVPIDVRDRVARLLDQPVDELFTPDALGVPNQKTRVAAPPEPVKIDRSRLARALDRLKEKS